MTYIIIAAIVAVILIVLLVAICLICKARKSVSDEDEDQQEGGDQEDEHPVGNKVSPGEEEKAEYEGGMLENCGVQLTSNKNLNDRAEP